MAVSQKHAQLSPDEASVFCYQLALMHKAGIGSEEGVAILAEDARSPAERSLLEGMHKTLLGGAPLDQALAGTGAFPAYLIGMVSIGQLSGRLDEVLAALAVYYRQEAATQSAVRRAITYPIMMGVLIAAIFLVLMARVFPVFAQVFSQLGLALPPMALRLMRFSEVSRYAAAAFAALLLAGALFALFLLKTKRGAALSARLSAGTFANGAAAQAVGRSRFASAMALMLTSGLPLDVSMDHACKLLEGSSLAPRLAACREHMYAGLSFPAAVEQAGILDGLQSSLLAAGFRSGATEQAMGELARRCQDEADRLLSRMLSRFEYAIVIVLCGAVGLVLLSVMLPLLSVMSAIGG